MSEKPVHLPKINKAENVFSILSSRYFSVDDFEYWLTFMQHAMINKCSIF